jgi:hypothetical protein
MPCGVILDKGKGVTVFWARLNDLAREPPGDFDRLHHDENSGIDPPFVCRAETPPPSGAARKDALLLPRCRYTKRIELATQHLQHTDSSFPTSRTNWPKWAQSMPKVCQPNRSSNCTKTIRNCSRNCLIRKVVPRFVGSVRKACGADPVFGSAVLPIRNVPQTSNARSAARGAPPARRANAFRQPSKNG